MRRLFVAFILLAILVAGGVFFYTGFDQKPNKPELALRAIPSSAALILETEEAGNLWRDLSQTNIIWEDLKSTDFYFKIDRIAHEIDSLLKAQEAFRGYLSSKPIALSAHVSGARDYSYLLSIQLENEAEEGEVIKALPLLFKASKSVKTRTYDGVAIHSFRPAFSETEVHFFVQKRLLVLSLSSILVEESARSLQKEASVLTDQNFQKVRSTAGKDSRAQVFVNYQQLSSILGQYVPESTKKSAFFTQNFAEWSALDLDLKANAFALNGFVLSADSSDSWLDSFKDTEAPEMRLLDYIPSTTAYFTFFGFGDFEKFRTRQLEVFEMGGRIHGIRKKVEKLEATCNCDPKDLALNWIGSQAISFITEPASQSYAQNRFVAFEMNEKREAEIKLNELITNLKEQGVEMKESSTYRDFEIHHLPVGSFYGDVLSEAFSGLTDPFYTVLEDVVIMSNSVNALRSVLNAIELDNTLASDESFSDLSERFSDEAHFMLYSAPSRSKQIYQHLLSDEHASDLEDKDALLSNFQSFGYQVSYHKNDLFYNTVYLKHNPDQKQETNSLWELKLKASVSGQPILLKNHYTDALEVFVQDNENRIYLIGSTGRVIWEKELANKILGEVQQVDVYRNNKLQIVFSTSDRLYLLDRNGNDVESFPKKLPASASSGVGVVDYDKSREYRFFQPLIDGSVIAFDNTGKKVKGWEFKDNEAAILYPVEHIRIKTKDYLMAINKAGKIHLLNRKGKSRHKVDKRIEGPIGSFEIEKGKDISSTRLYYMDSLGTAHALTFNDRELQLKLVETPVVDAFFTNLDGDDDFECLALSAASFVGYSLSGEELFTLENPSGTQGTLQHFVFPRNKSGLGLVDPENDQLFLFNSKGDLWNGFPLYGSTAFAIGDMNRDGSYNLVTAGKGGFIYAYSIE